VIAISFGATSPMFKEMSKLSELQFYASIYITIKLILLFLFQIIYLFMVHAAILILAMAMVNITLGQRPRGFLKENVS
jgi:hypothetical protein